MHFAREVGNGEKTRFWEDMWIGDTPLAHQFPILYNFTFSQNTTVAKVFNEGVGVH